MSSYVIKGKYILYMILTFYILIFGLGMCFKVYAAGNDGAENYYTVEINKLGYYSFNSDIYFNNGFGMEKMQQNAYNGDDDYVEGKEYIYVLGEGKTFYVKQQDYGTLQITTWQKDEKIGGPESATNFQMRGELKVTANNPAIQKPTESPRSTNQPITTKSTTSQVSSTSSSEGNDGSVGNGKQNEDSLDTILAPLVKITQILLLVGAGVCIGKLLHIGILFMTSSVMDKSNAKMAMLPWVIGTFVCFGASVIGSFVIKILEVNKDVLSY